jgi:uncharacterized membrane protein YbaN (DUF454 family)
MKIGSLRKGFLVSAGVVFLALAAIGVVLPLVPTTPFLLLAAACFVRSSDRLYRWLITHRVFGAYIRNYREHRAVTLRAKVVTVSMLWAAIGYSVVVVARSPLLRLLLLSIAAGTTTYVLRLKTLSRDALNSGSSGTGAGPGGQGDEPPGRARGA